MKYFWIVNDFKESMTQVYKIERTILKTKRMGIFDDMSGLESELKKDVMNAEAKLANYQGGKHGEHSKRFMELYREIEAKKESLAVNGKSPQERAEDFAKLNYLLQYLRDDYDPQSGTLPDPTDKPGYARVETHQPGVPVTPNTGSDPQKRIRIARIKALAKLKMLELLNV